MTSVQCAHVGRVRCPESASVADVYCSTHRYLMPVRTLGGSWSLRGRGALSYEVKLDREQRIATPLDSAGCDGFPYLTSADLRLYADWRSGYGQRPNSLEILDRFPVLTYETLGQYVRGTEDAIFSEIGQLFALSTDHPKPSIVMEGNCGHVRYFRVSDRGQAMFAVRDNQPYQVVTIDMATLDALAGV